MKKTDYKYGFTADIEEEDFPQGLNRGIGALISEKRADRLAVGFQVAGISPL